MNPQPPDATSPHSTWEERRGWLLFVEAKFPNYERFWQTFVVPRIKHAKYYAADFNILDDVPSHERHIINLNFRVFIAIYQAYRSLEKKQGTASRERWDFRDSVSHLAAACDRVDLLLFLSLLVTSELPEDNSVHQTYLKRNADYRAAVKTANAPYEGRLLYPDEGPPPTPRIPVLLPAEHAARRELLALTTFDVIAGQIHHSKEAIYALFASHRQYWLKDYDKHIAPKIKAEDKAVQQETLVAIEAAIQTILGAHPTMRDLTKALADSLTAEINNIWGDQLLPLVTREAKTSAAEPTKTV